MFGLFKRKKLESEPPKPPNPPNGGSGDADGDDPQKFIQQIPEFAELHVAKSKDNFDVSLDYSENSLRQIDEIITKHWPEPPVFLNQVVMTFGSYVGETVRRLLGGRWEFDADRGYTLADIGGTGSRIYPFAKVHKRFTNGEEDSIAYYFQVVCKIVADEKAEKADDDDRYKPPGARKNPPTNA
jgi:hypothetical protein